MVTEDKHFWTHEQFEQIMKCFSNKHLNPQEIQTLTGKQLVQGVSHELTQKSAIAAGFLEVLLCTGGYGFVNEKQKDLLRRVEKEIQDIQVLNKMLRIWLSGQ